LLNSKEIQTLTDNQLVESYKQTVDYNYIGELYQRHTQFVFAVCMKYLKNEDKCRDSVMEIFEKLIDDLVKFDIENFKPWLHTVTKNHCLLSIRSEGYKNKFETRYKKEVESFVENEDDLYLFNENEKQEEFSTLNDAVNELNNEQKECIELFYLKEKSYNEVADITGYSMKQVKSYIQNGKRNLKQYLIKNQNINIITIIMFLILFNI